MQRRQAASLRRDGALNRLSSITAATAVGTMAAVGALGVYVAKALPGHNARAGTGGSTAAAPSGNSGQGAVAPGVSGALNPPSAPPQPTSSPPAVTSGST